MRVYVAGKFEEKEAVRAAQAALRARGHIISYDWTEHEIATADHAACAEADLNGVLDADALLLLWHPSLRGGLVELGAALCSCVYVIVVGCPPLHEQPNVFFHHLGVRHVATVEDAVAWIEAME